MAEGFLRAFGGNGFDAYSAGTRPSTLNPLAVRVMREVGIDISGQCSKDVSEFIDQQFALVVTVCDNAREHCPYFAGAAHREHWRFHDPAEAIGTEEERLEVFRRVRDEIGARVREFVGRLQA